MLDTLRKKCPYSVLFILARIFPYLDWIWRDTENFSVLSLNEGKCEPE